VGSPYKLDEPRTLDVDGRELTFTREGESVRIRDGHLTVTVPIEPRADLRNQQLAEDGAPGF
jgi:hypothetical protein